MPWKIFKLELTGANLISPNGWGAYTVIGGYWTWQFKFRNVNRLNLLFWNLISYNSTQFPYCSFRKYIISRKQCEVPLSVPWNPSNQVSQHNSVWLQEESGLKQLIKHEVTTYRVLMREASTFNILRTRISYQEAKFPTGHCMSGIYVVLA